MYYIVSIKTRLPIFAVILILSYYSYNFKEKNMIFKNCKLFYSYSFIKVFRDFVSFSLITKFVILSLFNEFKLLL